MRGREESSVVVLADTMSESAAGAVTGSFVNRSPSTGGVLCLEWSNAHSRLRSKTLSFSLALMRDTAAAGIAKLLKKLPPSPPDE